MWSDCVKANAWGWTVSAWGLGLAVAVVAVWFVVGSVLTGIEERAALRDEVRGEGDW